jgi:hypothetical protein
MNEPFRKLSIRHLVSLQILGQTRFKATFNGISYEIVST